jgi:predicted 2-oxoglutarate/Fe(II)-dependent dioxygenase YbiX
MTVGSLDSDKLFKEGVGFVQSPDGTAHFRRGTEMLEQAAVSGHPDALCQVAAFAAIGIGQPQNWRRALDLLNQAAAAGSELAQAQKRLLESEASLTRKAGSAGTTVEALLIVPEREVLSETPRIRNIRRFLSPAACEWIITRAQGRLAPAMVYDEMGLGRVDPFRSNKAVELKATDIDVVTQLARTRISLVTRLPEPLFEAPQVMHYSTEQEFKQHFDFLDPQQPGEARDLAARGQRIATFLLYLNDDYEGGETYFPRCGLSWKGSAGDALFFANVAHNNAPDPMTLHAGKPPLEGEKWIFSQWIRDRSPLSPAFWRQ